MSFSGLKTAMLNPNHKAQQKGGDAAGRRTWRLLSAAVSEELVPRTMAAARQTGYCKVAVVGGRGRQLPDPLGSGGRLVSRPAAPVPAPWKLCGDNGSMIGSQGYYEYLAGT